MAKKKAIKIKDKKDKKKWFSLLAPAIFSQKELPDIIAFEPKELIGRKVEVSLKEFTANPKDTFKRIICKITKVQGDTAHTEADKYFMADSYIQRTAKRAKSRVILVQKFKTRDDKILKIKACALISGKTKREIKTKIAKLMADNLTREVGKIIAQEAFGTKFISDVFSNKKQISKIYPIYKILVWKISAAE